MFEVSISEGRDLSRQYNTAFHEVSVADDPTETLRILNTVVRELSRVKRVERRGAWPGGVADSGGATPPSGQLTEKESRKVSVFNMSRMFSSILGRSSLPPELGDRQRSNNSTGMSLKKVFQKRSV